MSNLNDIIANLQDSIEKTNQSLKILRDDKNTIEEKYHPVTEARRNFNNWRDSYEGKKIKQKLYESQGCRCANPECLYKGESLLPVEHFEIDHNLPISKYPELALDINNMKLLCSHCNKKKNTNI